MSVLEREVQASYGQGDDPLKTLIGMGVLIVLNENVVAEQSRVLTVIQSRNKPETRTIAGTTAIVQETLKLDERGQPELRTSTLLGAMDEVMDSTDMHHVGVHFHRVIDEQWLEVPLQSLPGKKAGLEVVIFDGPEDYGFYPGALHEVSGPPAWMTVKDILQGANIRDTSRELVTHAVETGMIRAGLNAYQERKTVPVFPRNHDFDGFRTIRDAKVDITSITRKK